MNKQLVACVVSSFLMIATACDAPSTPATTNQAAPVAAPLVTRERVVRLDLLAQSAVVAIANPSVPQPQANVRVASWGEEADVLWINPGARIQFDSVAIQAGDHLETSITIHDQSIGASDGASFIVLFNDGASETELFRRDVDRAAIDAAGGWLKVDVDLAAASGRIGSLIFTLEPGAAGVDVGDWGLWASPAIKS